MISPKILIVEDAMDVASVLKRGLSEEGFEVGHARSGQEALQHLSNPWDLVILDLTLPDLPGERVLTFLTQRSDHPPVLVLTARDRIEDKVALFEQGCDDYLTKPFSFEELLGRVRALLRRSPKSVSEGYIYQDMSLDTSTNELQVGDSKVQLTPKEFAICRLLMREPGYLVSKGEMLHSVWGFTREPKTNFLDVHMANLRKKLSSVQRDTWLQTVRSSGFLLSRPASL